MSYLISPPDGCATLTQMPRILGYTCKRNLIIKYHRKLPKPVGRFICRENMRAYAFYDIAEFEVFYNTYKDDFDLNRLEEFQELNNQLMQKKEKPVSKEKEEKPYIHPDRQRIYSAIARQNEMLLKPSMIATGLIGC